MILHGSQESLQDSVQFANQFITRTKQLVYVFFITFFSFNSLAVFM